MNTRAAEGPLYQVTPQEAVADWAWYDRQIQRVIDAADGGQYPDNVLSCVQFGNMQLWRTFDKRGMAVTELQDFPRYRQLLVYMVAGSGLRDWMQGAHQQLEDYAKSQHCSRMAFHGRPGWAKWANEYGYTHLVICMKKRLA